MTTHLGTTSDALGDRSLKNVRLLVVTRHAVFTEALTASLEEQGARVVGSRPADPDPHGSAPTAEPQLGILEEHLPAAPMTDVAVRTRQEAPQVKLVLISNRSERAAEELMADGIVDAVVPDCLGLEPLLATLVGVLNGHRVHAHRRVLSTGFGGATSLSEREEEVLQLLTSGATNAEIGEKLGISVNTVRSHVHNLLQKLGVHHRSDAVRIANRMLRTTA